jgi:hypothetical protein
MDRHEAVKVLREILSECDGALLMSSVSLLLVSPDRGKNSSSFELRIGCCLDDYLRKCISAVLEKHNLAIRELGSSVVIYSP